MSARLRLKSLAPHGFALGLALTAALVAWRVGGGAEAATTLPRAELAEAASPPQALATGGDTYEVSARLIESASDARFDFPDHDAARAVLRAHWRRERPPYFPPTGEAARFVATTALRTSVSEIQYAMPVGKEGKEKWAPDARIWNMNEGSFDQRESLLAPGPGSITYRVTIPSGAKLTFAEGTLNATREATVFAVTVIDPRGAPHEVYRHALPPSASRRWTEASCDLSAWAGQEIELRLTTKVERAIEPADEHPASAEPSVPESAYSGPGNGRPSVDAGVVREDALTTPSSPVALWGNPTILGRTTPRLPYNVLWIVVDALRPDVIASMHDDREDSAKEKAPWPPLEALLPKVPGLTPAIDDIARRGVRFTHAYSVGSWTRPGTIAMLAGARSTELGIDTTTWMLGPAEKARFYGSNPPLLSLILRAHAATTRAFVNNYFMVGYAPVGIEMGFERVVDHRYRTRDTLEITNDATSWIKKNKDTRFFAFVNYNSPHEPYEPPAAHLEKVPPPPAGPKDQIARLYMAEAAKDDEAIGVLMRTLDEEKLRERTIVVVTADHGETMSSAHSGTSGLDKMPIRYHHAVSNFEETTKVPIVISAPGLLPENQEVKARVRTTDIAPTILDLLGVEPHARMSGSSMMSLVKGQAEPSERVVVSEGRGSRAILYGHHRLLVREGAARIVIKDDKKRETDVELYDLRDDPGERHDLASKKPDVVAEMKARLEAALKNVAVAGAATKTPSARPVMNPEAPPTLHLRFVGGAASRRVSGTITLGDAHTKPNTYEVSPVELGRDAFHVNEGKVEVALRTSPDAPVGFDIVVEPATTPIGWELWLDDHPWPEQGIFGGPFGLLAESLRRGVSTDEARLAAHATLLPTIDPRRDVGLFVARERRGAEGDGARETPEEGSEEMARLLREWGYAHGSSTTR